MSMRHWAMNDYGLLLTEENLKTMASMFCDDFTEDAWEDDYFEFTDVMYDAGIIEYVSDFTGEAIHTLDDGKDYYEIHEDTYWNDVLFYVPAANVSTLFKAAYKDIDEMVAEFKEEVGKFLPEGFDYRKYIRHIVGTYYG